jgi:hypothetical protein
MDQVKNIILDANSNVRVYFIKKQRGKGEHSAIIFPNNINTKIKKNYQENFNQFTDGKGIREYDGLHQEIDTIQTVPTNYLEEWIRRQSAIEVAQKKNALLNKQNFSDDYSLIIIMFERKSTVGIQNVYLVAKYRKVDTWYKKSIKYSFTGHTLKEVDDEIYILNGSIDAVISSENTYILMQNNFELIFNYYKKIEETFINNKNNIENWAFLDNPKKFYNSIKDKKGATKKMARILQKSLETINNLTPQAVKRKLSKHKEFKDIQYDKKNRIIVTDKNRDLIINILLNIYAKNILTDQIVQTKGT